jgi:hypothetical protein
MMKEMTFFVPTMAKYYSIPDVGGDGKFLESCCKKSRAFCRWN